MKYHTKMNEIHAVIPAAGKAKNKVLYNTNLPDAMTPINGKPVIGYILEDLLQRGIQTITIILSQNDIHTEPYTRRKFGSKCFLTHVYNNKPQLGLGYSIYLGTRKNHHLSKVLVYLGDTIYKGKLSFTHDFLVVTPHTGEPEKWCIIETKDDKIKFFDKVETYKGSGNILCGIYFFSSINLLLQSLKEIKFESEKVEISAILDKYQCINRFKLIRAKDWYDCGNVENYYRAKIDFLKPRSFNKLVYNDLYGYITKKSNQNQNKIRDEIRWYRLLPKELQLFTPRLINFKQSTPNPEYSIEYYGYQSLADIFTFESISTNVWQSIITRIFDIQSEFKKYKHVVPIKDYTAVYIKKTHSRINYMRKIPWWKNLFDQQFITINGKKFRNLPHFIGNMQKHIIKLYNKKHMGIIHGDLCLGNILFDPGSRLFKLIDPRGKFGSTTLYGDSQYDVAKLRHSFSGLYDFIMSDLFEIHVDNYAFKFSLFSEVHNETIAHIFDAEVKCRGFDLNNIKYIEALLFLSMLPLHKDNLKRQQAMYLQSMRLFNELI